MTKAPISSFLTYPVFRLGDSPFTRKLHSIHQRILGLLKVGLVVLPALIFVYLIFGFYIPSKINFSTHAQNCIFAPSILPRLTSATPTENYRVTTPSKFSVNGYPLLSSQMCIEPVSVPPSGESRLSVRQFNLPINKILTVSSNGDLYASPMVKDDLVSTKSKLIFELSKPDLFFDYVLQVGDKSVDCLVQENAVACPTNELGLKQGEPYTFILRQTLGASSHSLFTDELTTITSVEQVSTSINAGQVVYDTPTGMNIVFSKSLVRANGVKLSIDSTDVPITYSTDEKVLSISWDSPLERQKEFKLFIDSVLATDGGYLEAPITHPFTTSGGPKVASSTLPSSKANTSVDFTLTLDHSPKPDQDLVSVISINSAGKNIPLTLSSSSNEIRIRTKSQLPTCAEFTVTITEKLQSTYGIAGGNAYSASSRTQCSRQFSIGKSVEGRDITAYSIGSGPSTVLYMGGIHGNEKSAYHLLSAWLDYLESNPSVIPSNRTIVIIPRLNPDGFTRNSRFNANNVDLNRNFASANWKKDVVVPGGSTLVNGGGSAPLSEPESQAIVNYINSTSPSLIMSYHSQGSIVIANGSGNSNSLASMYAGYVDYRHVATEASTGAFEHDTTGALEDWLHESPDVPVVLLELSSHTATGLFPNHKIPMTNVLK